MNPKNILILSTIALVLLVASLFLIEETKYKITGDKLVISKSEKKIYEYILSDRNRYEFVVFDAGEMEKGLLSSMDFGFNGYVVQISEQDYAHYTSMKSCPAGFLNSHTQGKALIFYNDDIRKQYLNSAERGTKILLEARQVLGGQYYDNDIAYPVTADAWVVDSFRVI